MSDPEHKNLPLEYAPPAVEREKTPVYPLIWWLGASPLVMGVAITILYYFTSWSWLRAVGLAIIFGGLVAVLIGGILLLSWWAQELGKKPPSRWAVHFRVAVAGMLLLSNFPAALICMSVAMETDTRLRIIIVNRGTVTVKQCAIVTQTQTKEVGPLAPGQTITFSMSNPNGGSLWLTRSTSMENSMVIICDYVDSDVHGPWSITIDGDDTTVRRSFPRR